MMTEWQLERDLTPGDDQGVDAASSLTAIRSIFGTESDDRRSGAMRSTGEPRGDGWLANEEELDRAEWFNEPWE